MSDISFPYSCNVTKRLPRRPSDGQIVCDREGNLWRYEAITDSWINHGTLEAPPTVSEDRDGLVTPDVFERLEILKEATNSGRDLPEELKILPHTDVYWYLFHSSDKLIRFRPEGPADLRLEVDRGRLFSLFVGMACRGPKGPQGEKGERGDDGLPGDSEPCFEPSSVTESGRRLNFDVVVPTPLSTDISLRLAADAQSDPVISILISLSGQVTLDSVNQQIDLDLTRTLTSIRYETQSQRLSGAFIRSTGVWSERCILARQKGPVGDKGDPGRCFPEVSECSVTHTDIQFTLPLVAIRKGCGTNQLLTMAANLFGKICVSKLRLMVTSPDYGNLFSGSAVSGKFLAASKTLEPCKDFAIYDPDLPVAARPALKLPDWQPQNDCGVAKRAELSDMNWVPLTDQAASTDLWDNPDGTVSPKYPWQIMVPQAADAGNCDPCSDELEEPPCP